MATNVYVHNNRDTVCVVSYAVDVEVILEGCPAGISVETQIEGITTSNSPVAYVRIPKTSPYFMIRERVVVLRAGSYTFSAIPSANSDGARKVEFLMINCP